MNTYLRFFTGSSSFVLLLLAAVIGLSCGCSKTLPDPVTDAGALLERYEKDRRRHDPVHFSEIDLGEVALNRRKDNLIYYIRFRLYAVVPDGLTDQFNELLLTHGERVNSKVLESARRCSLEQLNDPSLGWLKSDLISSVNRILQTPILRDVVFSDFSLECG